VTKDIIFLGRVSLHNAAKRINTHYAGLFFGPATALESSIFYWAANGLVSKVFRREKKNQIFLKKEKNSNLSFLTIAIIRFFFLDYKISFSLSSSNFKTAPWEF